MNRPAVIPPAPPARPRRVKALRGAALLIFLAVSLPVTLWGRNERSGWISMTQPLAEDHWRNSLLGYCYLHGAQPFMKENIPHTAQVGLFSGSIEAVRQSELRQDFRFIRGLYSFLASLLTPPLEVIPALLAVNWLCWAVCVWTSWRLTRDAFHSEAAAALAAALATGGMGMTAHIGDYSPHLLAFATYYLGVWLVYRSRVWRKRRGWATHLRLGAYLAVACLAYNTGVMLTAAYLAVAWRRNRILPLFAAAAFALAARPLWQLILGSRVEDVEADYLARSLAYWRALLEMDVYNIAAPPLRWLSEFVLFFDSPLAVVFGLMAVLLAPMPLAKRWFGLAFVAMPFLAGVVFAPTANARGYLVYGASVWVYACLAYAAARGCKSDLRWLRGLTCATAALVLATHFPWSWAHLARNLGPVKSYFQGWDDGWKYFPPAAVLSLTGREPTPVLFGGDASLAEAGAYVTPNRRRLPREHVSFGIAFLAGGFFFAYLGLLALAAARTGRQAVALAALGTVVYCGSCGWAALGFRTMPAFFPVDRAVVLQPGESLRLEATLSDQFAAAVQAAASDGAEVFLLLSTGTERELSLRFFAGEQPLATALHEGVYTNFHRLAKDDPRAGLAALLRRRRLTAELANPGAEPLELAGWQRGDLPGRSCVRLDQDGREIERPPVLPFLEIRVITPQGRVKLAGF